MLVFALVGGSSEDRDSATDKFAALMGATGVVYKMPPTIQDDARLQLLQKLFNPKNGRHLRLLLNNLVSKPEFDWVRSIGGYVVHVDGRPSSVIAMQEHDFYVRPRRDPRGRFDTVEQCYAALRLRYKHDAMQRPARQMR